MSSLDESQARYLDELIAAASVLVSLEFAAQAEAWVSGAVAEWQALDGPEGGLEPAIRAEAPLAADLLRWFEGGERPVGEQGWLDDLGRSELARVLRLGDPDVPDEMALIFEYELDGTADHDVSVSIVGGELTGVSVGPAGLAEGVDDDPDSSLVIEEMDRTDAVGLASEALSGSLEQLSPASEANVPLLSRRVGATIETTTGTAASRPLPPRDADDDAWCVGVVRSSLRELLDTPATDAVHSARGRFASLIESRDPDALTLLEVAGLPLKADIDLSALLDAVGGYFNPVDLSAHTDAQFEALTELEPVDWTGVVLGMVRSPVGGRPIDGRTMVTHINRAPEITSTIPKNDAPRLAWTFEQMLFAWEVTGVIDDAGQVTSAGRWLLAHGFVRSLRG